jgi:serine/threonine protein kinase
MVLAATHCQLAGRYRLCRWLAAGGMGQVWEAVDEVLDRPVAVKLLRDEYAHDPCFVRRLRAEARYGAAVTHPGIASVFDYGEVRTTDGTAPTPFLVMELVAGEPLSTLLAREGRLGLDRSLEIVGQAAVAVGAAHRAGLVHRDIKPANLLLGPDGTVKVTDFGVAQALGQGQGDHDELMCGTAGYLSPEQATGQPATAASDLYALGVVAYECLAGRRPLHRWASDRGRPGPSATAAASAARGGSWGGAGAGGPGDGQTADPPAPGRLELRLSAAEPARRSGNSGAGYRQVRLLWPPPTPTSRPSGHHGRSSSVTAAGAG